MSIYVDKLIELVGGFFCAFLFALLLVPVIRSGAIKFSIIDVPDGKIKKHNQATPYLGGLAIIIGLLLFSWIYLPVSISLKYFFVGLTILFFTGLIDDIFILTPLKKFLGQSLATLFFMQGGYYFDSVSMPLMAKIFSAFWTLTIINAFNLVDVMDGLASSLALGSCFLLCSVALYCSQIAVAILCAIMMGLLLGFLRYNWPQASIYLGDAGSLVLGGFLGALPFNVNFKDISFGYFSGYIIIPLILAIPLLEIISLIVIRTYKGIPFYKASPDHFSIYLRSRGWSTHSVLAFVYAMMAFIFILSVSYLLIPTNFLWLVLGIIIFLALWCITVFKGFFYAF